jgi:hypothetical protein
MRMGINTKTELLNPLFPLLEKVEQKHYFAYILPLFCLYFAFILPLFCLYFAFILPLFCLYFAFILLHFF